MNKILGLMLCCCIPVTATAQTEPFNEIQRGDTTCQIFIYSPGERNGLHLAYLDSNGNWQETGQLCSSDYGPWGAEKKMYTPFVARANDGTWRAVWSVNSTAPCFAAAYGNSLISWRPQDYPIMPDHGIATPILFPMSDGTCDVYYKTGEKKRYVHASADFRHFTVSNDACVLGDEAWVRDTAWINGRMYNGNSFQIPRKELVQAINYFKEQTAEAQFNRESMRNDATRYPNLDSAYTATLTVDPHNAKNISDKLMGVFFEDISYAADGGLYAEMLQNRDFEYTPADRREWNATTAWQSANAIKIDTVNALSTVNAHYAVLTTDTLFNTGWDGISVKKGENYNFSFFVRNPQGGNKTFMIELTDNQTVLAKAKIKTSKNAWVRYTAKLTPGQSAEKARLAIIPMGKVEADVDMASLFPANTFKNRPNGLRKDLAEAIAALHPKFMRFPGGCMSHGQGIDNIYHWNETVGPLEQRTPAKNIWGYHQTRGLGYYEYFQFCEDIGAEPLPVLAAGVPCQNSAANKAGVAGQQGGIPMNEMPAYCDEVLHLIEWANGDPATSKWARLRAEAGHPKPFNLKYIGIGNEDLISTTFEERYLMICKAVKQKYPNITVCGTVGPFHYPSSDYVEGWKIAKANHNIIDMVDEHYYESTGWFLNHQHYYDNYDRKGPKVYLGEYASQTRTMESALAEAVYLCSIERNGDVVSMTSYAPLLCKEGHANWNPDLIYFNNDTLQLTPSYYTQQIFSKYCGNHYLTNTINTAKKLPGDLSQRLASSVVVDSQTGTTYIRLINALPAKVMVDAEGISIPAGSQMISFSGKVTDTQTHYINSVLQGKITLQPYSVNVIIVH